MKTKLLFTLLFFNFYTITVRAQSIQEDYVITRKGDTIKAKIRTDFWNHIVYKMAGSDTIRRVDDGAVTEYFWHKRKNPTYVLLNLPGKQKPIFAERLERGHITLYHYRYHHGKSSTSYWYAQKGSSAIIEIGNTKGLFSTDPKLKENFANLIADNPILSQELQGQRKYGIKPIRALIVQYNTAG